MNTPLENHGGTTPSEFHTRWLPNTRNNVLLLVRTEAITESTFEFFQSLLLDRVGRVVFILKEQKKVPFIHPMVEYSLADPDVIVKDLKQRNPQAYFWTLTLDSETPIHPAFWDILEVAQKGVSYTFKDNSEKVYTLVAVSPESKNTIIDTGRIAAYSDFKGKRAQNEYSLHYQLTQKTKRSIPEITIDTTDAFTPLCHLATTYKSDKSPYNIFHHRHPYTGVYDTFFRPYTTKPFCKIGEVGVLNGASIWMWLEYFPTATIYGFDINEECLKKMPEFDRVHGIQVDASSPMALRTALSVACNDKQKFSILIEDASHWLDHQLLFLRDAIDFIEPGGLLVIEDIFREIPLARFEEALAQVSDRVLNAVMVKTEHEYKFSPDWNNDRVLLVWVR